MEPEVRYCTTEDGVRIAYCVEGEGPPLLALPFFIESFSLDHLLPEYRLFMRQLGAGRKLIRFDPRGVGLSQRHVTDLSPDALQSDGLAAAVACGEGKFSVWASTTAGPFAIRFALDQPERVESLILYGTCANIRDTFPDQVLQGFEALAAANWPLATQTFADLTGRIGFPDAAVKLAEWYRQSTDGATGAEFIRQSSRLDLTEQLADITVPTLVLHRINDPTFPFSAGKAMASSIPNARFVPMEGGGNLPPFGNTELILQAVRSFLDEGRPVASAQTSRTAAFRAVLFTDLVGHTQMMSRLGDERGRTVLREHERITREVLKQYGGTEIKTMGDGFMASFRSVTQAVECAMALQRAIAGKNEGAAESLHIRVGLNAGEPIEEEGDLFGATVILAARIAAKAEGDEILVANAVRELCSGKGFLFADRGDFVAKGFEEPVRVYEVRWREHA